MGQHQVCFLLRFSYNAINKSLPELLPGERKNTSKELLVTGLFSKSVCYEFQVKMNCDICMHSEQQNQFNLKYVV